MRDRDQQLRDARTAYLAAVRRLNHALIAFDNSGMPMDPGPGQEPAPWTHEHVRIMLAVTQGFQDTVTARRRWDELRREWQPGHAHDR